MNESPAEKVLILRTCEPDMTSYDGFVWPESGYVEAPDWRPNRNCGWGLHGFLWGEGNGGLANWDDNAKWLVAEVVANSIVDLGGKVKFPRANVVYCGDRLGATNYLLANGAAGKAVIGSTLEGGDYSTLTGGDRSTLTGGHGSKLVGGHGSKLVGGYNSTLTGGDYSTLTGGDFSTLTGGDRSTLTGGYDSTLVGGDYSTLTGGYNSTLTGGDHSTLVGGNYSTLTGGHDSTLTGGDFSKLAGGDRSKLAGGGRSVLQFLYWDASSQCARYVIARVGENGVLPGVAYRWGGTRIVEANQDQPKHNGEPS